MRKFDLESFYKHKKNGATYCRYITTDNNGNALEIYLLEHTDSYQQTVTYLNTPIKKRHLYDKKTLNVTKEIESFYDCIIGFRREFNEKGELIKEINNDKPFKFSWQDLVKKMKQEYAIDLMNENDQIKTNNYVSSVSRNSQVMKYFIIIPCEFTPHGVSEERFEIDATTGKTIIHIKNRAKSYPKTTL
ncbi:hypothetical protein OA88_06715 [Flavobacterium sp. JRM]|nr:hypothetical protein OA88_06715 [Flavobacterium sp. JRM]